VAAEMERSRKSAQGSTMTLDGKRILIIEDEYLIAMSVASGITELGGKVVGIVGSADDALDIIAATDVDGAIIDITLTGAHFSGRRCSGCPPHSLRLCGGRGPA
jgi:hypothetical protein